MLSSWSLLLQLFATPFFTDLYLINYYPYSIFSIERHKTRQQHLCFGIFDNYVKHGNQNSVTHLCFNLLMPYAHWLVAITYQGMQCVLNMEERHIPTNTHLYIYYLLCKAHLDCWSIIRLCLWKVHGMCNYVRGCAPPRSNYHDPHCTQRNHQQQTTAKHDICMNRQVINLHCFLPINTIIPCFL